MILFGLSPFFEHKKRLACQANMGYTNGKKPKVIFDSMRKYGDDGQMRALMIRYVQEKGTITPTCDHNCNVIK